ncbi:magnesium-protoporphyrin IX monomethyl ester anaerobic oxidative cyclase [uncultured Ruegeria sp.]|uniref:magnesium-protoporphyrin IX monomethyl ester anaerobic oxidative cyclase n=1 Tax=uncultured Ruegeria sp. TaxID=259304 RepID=UPI0026243E0C|nr:magnesium-protoporphyrin IX monomethyl ester anaerobic oxidative cyclase [uncultured Ruegeria sp.]
MRITLLHPPHTAIGSRVPRENLPPFGLLCIGGPLIDAGHNVTLINADRGPKTTLEILSSVSQSRPDAVLIGHSGSTSAHPTAIDLIRRIKSQHPEAHMIYGGVYPTYHWKETLEECPEITAIVRGEGEVTTPTLINALERGTDLRCVSGIAFGSRSPQVTAPARMIGDLNSHRIGWELIDFAKYSYWGGRRAVILQFSRGCPHLCTYCGQRGFWTKWRHRDPVKFAAEIGWLYRTHGVTLINLADENPTSSKKAWRAFLEAMIVENVPVQIIGSTRADDIVRDAETLHLYKKAGCLRFLLGLEGTDEDMLTTLKKGGSRPKDQQAIKLLREHGMIGLCTFAVGFEEECDTDYWRLLRHLLRYDPDQVMSIYATPHRWTPFFEAAKTRRIIESDLRNWDYKHQVMETPNVPSWRVFLWVKAIETTLQLRPRALWRCFLHPDPEIRHAMQWYTRMGRRVVLRELWEFLTHWRRPHSNVSSFLGEEPLPEQALAVAR